MASQRSSHHLIHTRLGGAKHTRNYLRNAGCRKGLLRTICLWDPLTAHKLGHLQSNRSQPSTWWKLSLLYTIGGDCCRPKWPCLVPAGSPGGECCIQRVGGWECVLSEFFACTTGIFLRGHWLIIWKEQWWWRSGVLKLSPSCSLGLHRPLSRWTALTSPKKSVASRYSS